MSRLHGGVALALAATLAFAAPSAAKPQRLPRGWAKKHAVGVRQGARDPDGDGLGNWGEWRAGTDPRTRDSDHDGVRDGAEDRDRDGLRNADEVALGTDPRTRDSDHDGVRDGREHFDASGTLTALSDTTVTLRLAGGSVTASVASDAAVSCPGDDGVDAGDDGVDAGDDSGDGADLSQADPGDTGDETIDGGEDPGDDSAGADAPAIPADRCAGALHVGASVRGELTGGPGGVVLMALEVR